MLVFALLGGTAGQDIRIGQVGEQPVFARQVTGSSQAERAESLRKLFIAPALKAYLEPHRKAWQLTEPEIEQLILAHRAAFKCAGLQSAEKQPPGFDRMFAQMMGGNAKVQRFIYEHNGRGRVLFQQAGTEAYDATRTLLLRLEREGKFAITDPALRAEAFSYWTNDQQSGLMPDPGPDKAFKLGEGLITCAQDAATAGKRQAETTK